MTSKGMAIIGNSFVWGLTIVVVGVLRHDIDSWQRCSIALLFGAVSSTAILAAAVRRSENARSVRRNQMKGGAESA